MGKGPRIWRGGAKDEKSESLEEGWSVETRQWPRGKCFVGCLNEGGHREQSHVLLLYPLVRPYAQLRAASLPRPRRAFQEHSKNIPRTRFRTTRSWSRSSAWRLYGEVLPETMDGDSARDFEQIPALGPGRKDHIHANLHPNLKGLHVKQRKRYTA